MSSVPSSVPSVPTSPTPSSPDTPTSSTGLDSRKTTDDSNYSRKTTDDYKADDIDDDVDGDNDVLQLQEIIWSVTHYKNQGTDNILIRDVLLLCHPVFCEPQDILLLLEKRFFTDSE
eukprot:70140_1